MSLYRRDFLQVFAGAPLVFGLRDLLTLESSRRAGPTWWEDALNRMKTSASPALVFVAPTPDERRESLAKSLMNLLESGDSRAHEIFCSAVVICLGPEMAKVCLPDSSDPGKVLVLEPSGKVLSTTDLSIEALKNPTVFAETFAALLHGEGNALLSKRADAVQSKMTEEEKRAVATIDAEGIDAREKASTTLAKNADALMPLLVLERRKSTTPERAARMKALIEEYFQKCPEKIPGPRLPFGTRIDPGWGCGAEFNEGASIQCGMARLEGKGERFLRFLKE